MKQKDKGVFRYNLRDNLAFRLGIAKENDDQELIQKLLKEAKYFNFHFDI